MTSKTVIIDATKEITPEEAIKIGQKDDAQVEANLELQKLKKLNIIIYGDSVTQEMEHPGRIVIDQAMAMQHYKFTVDKDLPLDNETLDYVGMIFIDNEVTKDNWKEHGTQVQYVIGRIDDTLKLQKKHVAIVWRYPEAGLFPVYQPRMADVIVKLFDVKDYNQSYDYEEKHHTLDINPDKMGGHTEEEVTHGN